MNLIEEVREVIVADADIVALIGGASSPRFWNHWPRTYAVPCIVMEIDGDDECEDLDGDVGLIYSDVVITCRAATDAAANSLWLLVRAKLKGYSGTFDAILENTVSTPTPKEDGSNAHWYDRIMNFNMSRTEDPDG